MLKVNLFGIPTVEYNENEVKFPFKKADALFYYLLLVKRTTRDHLVNLFWSDSEENVAKKNLRNAIYIIKKTLGVEILVSPQRSMVELNNSIELNLDVDIFDMDNERAVTVYKGLLLDGLNLKDCENFDNWLINQRQYYEGIYIQKTLKVASEALLAKNYKLAIQSCKKLIEIDPFDEAVYRMLMKGYFESGRYDKSLSIYEDLTRLLEEELAISPDLQTTELYQLIIEERSHFKKVKKDTERFFYGRQKELTVLYNNYLAYTNKESYHHYLIQGELGVGKTAMMHELIDQLRPYHVEVARVYCYQAIEGYNLKSWDDLIEKLGMIVKSHNIEIPEIIKFAIVSTFPSFGSFEQAKSEEQVFSKRTVENAIYELIKIVTGAVKLLIIFEDIQWLDEPSLILLKKLINERTKYSPIIYITCRNAHNKSIERFIAEFSSRDIIKKLHLERFTKDETLEFSQSLFPNKYDEIYNETEGNALFIMEYINRLKANEKGMSSKVKDAIKHRLLNISKDSLQVIQLGAVYLKRFTVDDIISITGKSEFLVLDLIEELENNYLIKEEIDENGDANYAFTHSKIKSYIYDSLSKSKQKILHTRIANRLELQVSHRIDRNKYSRLVYHYDRAKNQYKALEYRIKHLYEYLQSSHEVFPLIKERDVFNHESIFFDEDEIQEEFERIGDLLELLRSETSQEDYTLLLLKFKHMIGRHYINNGFYNKGLEVIKEVVNVSQMTGNNEYLIKGYLQNAFYSINTHNMDMMHENINAALRIAHHNDMRYEIGILLRLKGLYYVLQSDFEKGESLLLTSIDIMMKFKDRDKYTLNIAAAYYYMGDSNRFKGNFETAINYYEKAIEICENNDLLGRLTVFYTNAGHSAYNLGDYLRARRYFESAIKLYEQLDFPWRRSIAYGFLGLLCVKDGKDDKALSLFEMADKYSAKMKNPYELAVVCRIKSELENMLLEGNIFSSRLAKFIEAGGEDYLEKGMNYLEKFENCYEMRRLKELKIKRQLL